MNCELSEIIESISCDYFVKALIENTFYSLDIRKWAEVENFMNKNHFDWKHNLIENGLAISIHNIGAC